MNHQPPYNVLALYAIVVTILLLAFYPTGTLGAGCVAPPAGIVAWWPFDETSGTSAHDIVGPHDGAYAGTLQNTGGLVGGALQFNGLNTYVTVPDSDLWAFGTTDFTIEFWANFDVPAHGTAGHPGTVFLSNDNGPFINDKWIFALSSTSLEFIAGELATGSDVFAPVVPFAPEVGRWYHVALTRSGTSYKIYVDGMQVGATGANLAVIPNPASPLTIGAALEPLGTGGGFGGVMSGRLDEVTIYHRQLRDQEIQAIASASAAGKCKQLTITTKRLSAMRLGDQAFQTLHTVSGKAPITWQLLHGHLPAGLSLTDAGMITGIAQEAGSFELTVQATDANGLTASTPLTLDVLLIPPPPDIRVRKSGTTAVPGRIIDYFISVKNEGEADTANIEVLEVLNPPSFFAFNSAAPAPTLSVPSGLFWIVPNLAPQETVVISYRVTLNTSVPIGTPILGGEVCAGPVGTSAKSRVDEIDKLEHSPTCDTACASIIIAQLCDLARDACKRLLPPAWWEGDPLGPSGDLEECMSLSQQCIGGLGACGCGENPDPGECTIHSQPARGPLDPNEKLVVAKNFVRPDETLVYPIRFENIGSVEAKDVFVTDVLDPGLDESTLSILTPIGASFDAPTRTLRWKLLNINLAPGSTGSLIYTIRPKAAALSGTKIRNKATIQFEVFTPLDTNMVETIIDTTRPTCVVNALSAGAVSRRIPVTWVATDAVGEVESTSVLVSVDEAPFTLFQTDTTATSAVFQGSVGHSYGFLCVAKDTAGNVEIKNPVAEARTQVTGFADVATDNLFFPWIQALFEAGLTGGCSTDPPEYCPSDSVTRGQMAVFLVRGIHGDGFAPPAATLTLFADVTGGPFASWIEQLYHDGITSGCGFAPLRYCPDDIVTRAQMAIFLLRAKHGMAYQPPAASGMMFSDVTTVTFAAAWIEQLAREGITGGCATSPARYCPDDPVTRAQMAVFLVRTFNLPL